MNVDISLNLLLPLIWPGLFSMLCFVAALQPALSALGTVFYFVGLVFTLHALAGLWSLVPCEALGSMYYDSLFVWGGIMLTTLFIVIGALNVGRMKQAERWGLLLLVFLGALVILAAKDLLLLFVALEMFFILLVLWMAFFEEGDHPIYATVRLFLTGAFAAGFTVLGISFLFGSAGSLNLADIGRQVSDAPSFFYAFGLLMFLVGIFFKLSVVPFHHWAAEVYQDHAYPVIAMLAVVSKFIGIFILMRVFFHLPMPRELLVGIAALTMTVGNVAALVQQRVKRLLAFSSIAHVGFLLMALVGGNLQGFQAMATYLIYYTFTFMAIAGVLMLFRSQEDRIEEFDGLSGRHPYLALTLTVCLLALAGIPPTLGFIAKWKVFEVAYQTGQMGLLVVAILNSLVAAYYYLAWIVRMYMKQGGTLYWPREKGLPVLVTTIFIMVGLLALSVYPEWLNQLSSLAISNIL